MTEAEWVKVYPATWDKILSTFGWTRDRIESDAALRSFKLDAANPNNGIYHELPLTWLKYWIIPDDIGLASGLAGIDLLRLGGLTERAFEGEGSRFAYFENPHFDWNAAKLRVEAIWDEWRRSHPPAGK